MIVLNLLSKLMIFMSLVQNMDLIPDIVVKFCKSFATHVDLPKENWFKYHEPIKDICKEPIIASTEIQTHTVNLVVPTAYIEKTPFPIRIKEHSKATTVVHKSHIKAPKHSKQIKVEPSIAMAKDRMLLRLTIPSLQLIRSKNRATSMKNRSFSFG